MSDKSTPFVDDGVGGAAQSAMLRRVLGIALPAGFLLLSVWLAFDELRALDLHALRASIREVPAATLLLLQAGALLAVPAMGMYDLYFPRGLCLNVARGPVPRLPRGSNKV